MPSAKYALNVTKTEVVIFRAKGKVFDTDLKLKMCGKKLYPSHHVKYLGVYLDEYLNWATHVNQLCVKLVKASAILSKIYFINETTLQSIYFAIFNSHLSYACTAWRQSIPPFHRVGILQRNALQIIYFAKFNDHATQLFCKMKTIKFVDMVSGVFINKCFSFKSYSVFSHLYNLATARHNHQTRFAMNGLSILPSCNTSKFGTKAFLYSTITSWNSFEASEKNFRILSPISLTKFLKDDLILLLHYYFNILLYF